MSGRNNSTEQRQKDYTPTACFKEVQMVSKLGNTKYGKFRQNFRCR